MKVPSKIKLPIQIRKGRFASNLNMVRTILEHYNDCAIDVTFSKKTNKRSSRQNAYYWGVIIPIIQNCIKEEWGEVAGSEETNNFLKTNCNFVEVVNEDTGQVLRRVKSSKTENTTIDQEKFHENCRTLALDFFNTEIPLPKTNLTLKFDQ